MAILRGNGDSIMLGNEMNGDGNQYTHRWMKVLADLLSCTEDNGGWSGARLVEDIGGNSFEADVTPTVHSSDVLYYLLAYAVNDYYFAKAGAETIEVIIPRLVTGFEQAIDRLVDDYSYPVEKIIVPWYYLRTASPVVRSEWVSLKEACKTAILAKGAGFCDLDAYVDEQTDKANYAVEDNIHPHEYTAPNNWNTRMGENFMDYVTFASDIEVITFKTVFKLNINTPPTANAGTDQSLSAGTTTATLSGSGSDEEGSVTYLWTQLSGPNTAGITSPTSASSGLTGLVEGTYVFQLAVTDTNGSTTTDTVNVVIQASATAFVTGVTSFGSLRNDFTGGVGMQIVIGGSPITVSQVGRWVVSGNSGTHSVEIYNSGGTLVASGTVNTSGATSGAFAYAACTPVVLAAGGTYYVISQETNGGDQWYNSIGSSHTIVTKTGVASIVGAYYRLTDGTIGGDSSNLNEANNTYVIVNIKYTV